MTWTQEEVDNIIVEAKKRAITDKSFRELVLADPKAAIEKISGKPVPAVMKIKVIESDPNYHVTFVLPKFVGDELSFEDLENVAGGLCDVNLDACAGKVCGAHAER